MKKYGPLKGQLQHTNESVSLMVGFCIASRKIGCCKREEGVFKEPHPHYVRLSVLGASGSLQNCSFLTAFHSPFDMLSFSSLAAG